MAVTKFVKLKDCATIIAGQSPQSKYYNTIGEGVPFFQGKADFGELYPTVRVYCSKSTKIAEKDDILLSVRAPVGPTNLSPGKVCIGRGLTAIRPDDSLDLKYLLNYFRYFEIQLASKGTGTTFKAITQAVVKNLEIPIPPKDEQRRIVSLIEELFSKLDKGVETLQTIKQQLAVYRQAVLTEAFEGIENTVELGSIASIVDPHPSHRTPVEVIGGVPYIGVGDIDYVHHVIDFSSARKVSNDILQDHLSRYTLHDGDFIMGKIGTIGKPFIIALPQNYTLSANVILIQPNKKVVIPKYLFWQVSSSQITKQLLEGSTSTTQPAFGIKKARLLSIKICSLEEQNRIVQKIESHLSLCDDIGQSVTAALSQAEALRQSILKQAFEGKL